MQRLGHIIGCGAVILTLACNGAPEPATPTSPTGAILRPRRRPRRPTGPPAPTLSATIVIMPNNSFQPAEVKILVGGRVTFINQNNRAHDITSDPLHLHTDCPPVMEVGFIQPGQTKVSGALNTIRTCGFHDHMQENNLTCTAGSSSRDPANDFPARNLRGNDGSRDRLRGRRPYLAKPSYSEPAARQSGPPVATTTITITAAGVNPRGSPCRRARVTFVNNDTRTHEMNSDPHPNHGTAPPSTRRVSKAGQTKQTGNRPWCGRATFDHNQPTVTSLQGQIIVQ